MGRLKKFSLFVVIVVIFVTENVSGVAISKPNPDTTLTPGPKLHSGWGSPLNSTEYSENVVRIVDFVAFNEEEHEAEFIIDLVQTSGNLGSIKLSNYRSMETILSNDVTTSGGDTKLAKRVRITVPCRTSYALYPSDKSVCSFIFLPEGGPWRETPSFKVCPGGMDAYEFRVIAHQAKLSLYNSTRDRDNVDVLSINILIQRTSAKQIFSQIYSPITTMVWMSYVTMWWGSFAIKIGASLAIFLCSLVVTTMVWEDIPREKDGQTATEYFMLFCIGFIAQVVLTNILTLGYLSKEKSGESGADGSTDKLTSAENGQSVTVTEEEEKLKVSPEERHILAMGKYHRYVYFTTLRPAKWKQPLFFVLFLVIFFIVVVILSAKVPEGFELVAKPTPELERLCLGTEFVRS